MIVFYSKTCEGCSGNQALTKMKSLCEKNDVDFQERRTVLWIKYEEEANAIMEETNVEMPFFYNDETGEVLHGDTFTPIEKIKKLLGKEEKSDKKDE